MYTFFSAEQLQNAYLFNGRTSTKSIPFYWPPCSYPFFWDFGEKHSRYWCFERLNTNGESSAWHVCNYYICRPTGSTTLYAGTRAAGFPIFLFFWCQNRKCRFLGSTTYFAMFALSAWAESRVPLAWKAEPILAVYYSKFVVFTYLYKQRWCQRTPENMAFEAQIRRVKDSFISIVVVTVKNWEPTFGE